MIRVMAVYYALIPFEPLTPLFKSIHILVVLEGILSDEQCYFIQIK
jgi:hypothetical protein